jgi:hypothetical protein
MLSLTRSPSPPFTLPLRKQLLQPLQRHWFCDKMVHARGEREVFVLRRRLARQGDDAGSRRGGRRLLALGACFFELADAFRAVEAVADGH